MKNLIIFALIIYCSAAYSQKIGNRSTYLTQPNIENKNIPLYCTDGEVIAEKLFIYLLDFNNEKDADVAYIDGGSNEFPWIHEPNAKHEVKGKYKGFKSPTWFQSEMHLINYMYEHGYEFKGSHMFKNGGEFWTALEFNKI